MPADPAASPYQHTLGRELTGLHPKLLAYFSALPPGSVGQGSGVFDVVGTPRRWLWPALWVLGRAGILFPVWEHGVPFTVTNRPTSMDGFPAVAAVRQFRFTRGTRDMTDLIAARGDTLVDRLGLPRLLEAAFDARVVDGALELTSTRVGVILGPVTVRIPAPFAPVVRLSERFDDASDRQQVRVTIDAPVLGRLYEYSGSFSYSVDTGGEPS